MSRRSVAAFVVCLALAVYGCGGGSSSTPPPGPSPSFSFQVAPANPGVAPGGSAPIQVTLQPQNGFTGSVLMTISNLPVGLSAAPASFTLTTSGKQVSQSVTLTASANLAQGNYTISLSGTGGNATSSLQVTIAVAPLANFTVTSATTELAVRFGGSVQASILTILNGSNGGYTLNFSASGLPQGVSATFSPNPVTPGQNVVMTVMATSTAPAVQNVPTRVTATRSVDSFQETLRFFLSVAPPPGQLPGNRSDFVRVDGGAPLGATEGPTQGVYDAPHQRVLVSNLSGNRVEVISLASKQVVQSIPVPRPWGLDLSLDGTKLLVGTLTPQLFTIDLESLTVVRRDVVPRPPSPVLRDYSASVPRQMKNGKILILSYSPVSTETWLLAYNPLARTATIVSPPISVFGGRLFRNSDGSKAILDSDVEPNGVVIYDATSDSFTARKFPGFASAEAISPDGSQCVIIDDVTGLILYDSALNVLGPLTGGQIGGTLNGAVYSPDGSKIHLVVNSNFTPTVVTIDAKTRSFLGNAPALAVIPPHVQQSPTFTVSVPFAADNTGLVFGGTDHGLTIEDATFFQNFNGAVGNPVFDKFVSPTFGPVNSTTRVTFGTSPFNLLPDVWFGDQRGTDASLDSVGFLDVTTPALSTPGSVNVKAIDPAGIQVFDPLAFSYGPQALFLLGTVGSPAGGGPMDILALGMPTDTSQIQVKVGGANATVVGANPITYGPFPTVNVKVRIPTGTTGPADVTLMSPVGTTTLSGAFHYAKSFTDYASPDKFQAILYDRFRKQLYLSAGDHIDVFSLQTKSFASSFQPPAVNGKRQFAGIALTPDGSKLIIANNFDGSVAVVNPDNSSTAVAVNIAPTTIFQNCINGPFNVATTSDGRAFVVTGGIPGIGCGPGGQFYQLNLATMQVSSLVPTVQCGSSYLSSTRDSTRIVLSGSVSPGGQLCIYDVAANTWSQGPFDYFSVNAAAAGDGNVFAGQWHLYDAQAKVLFRVALPRALYPDSPFLSQFGNVSGVSLEKLNDSGSLLFVSWSKFVDIFDVRHAEPRARITLNETVPFVVDALAIAPDGTGVFLITDAGLTIIELDTVPLSVGSITPAAATPGMEVVVRGSGFVTGTQASFNSLAAATTFVDPSTLRVTLPLLPMGAARLTLTNPNGESYSLDNALTAQ